MDIKKLIGRLPIMSHNREAMMIQYEKRIVYTIPCYDPEELQLLKRLKPTIQIKNGELKIVYK